MSKCVATAGVPIRMLRNLGILKIELFWPIRSDQYNAGPRDVIRTSIAIAKIGARKIADKQNAKMRSAARFMTG